MQTKIGAERAMQTIYSKHGKTPDGRSLLHVMAGARGGRVKNPNKGFGSNREAASKYGRVGGLRPRRGKKS